jgi:hypothetical protein
MKILHSKTKYCAYNYNSQSCNTVNPDSVLLLLPSNVALLSLILFQTNGADVKCETTNSQATFGMSLLLFALHYRGGGREGGEESKKKRCSNMDTSWP